MSQTNPPHLPGQVPRHHGRAEKVAAAQRFSGEGLTLTQIAEQLGVTKATVCNYLRDPDGSRARAYQKTSYHGVCVDCGARVSGKGPEKVSRRCARCNALHSREFGVEAPGVRRFGRQGVIAAIRLWAAEHDGVPPTATDWNPSTARLLGHDDRAEEFEADGRWPHMTSVNRAFGPSNGWSNAIRAAGFKPRGPGDTGDVTDCSTPASSTSTATAAA